MHLSPLLVSGKHNQLGLEFCHNFMIFLLCILDLKNRDHRKFKFYWPVSFKHNFLLLLLALQPFMSPGRRSQDHEQLAR